MNTTVNGLGSTGIGSLGNSIAGQVAQNNARDRFGASVNSWNGGAQSYTPSPEGSGDSAAQQQAQENAVQAKALPDDKEKQIQKWRQFYNLAARQKRDYSSEAHEALLMSKFFNSVGSAKGKAGFSPSWQMSLSA